YGTLRVEPDTDGLRLYAGHLTEPYFLLPYDGDTFREKGTGTAVKFTAGSNGTVTGVHVVMLDYPWIKGDFVRTTS
ncbi:MAG: serine hydrolase, partial [Methanomicrobiales archaeon]